MFIYNKTERMSAELRQKSLGRVCEHLGIDSTIIDFYEDTSSGKTIVSSLNYVNALGFDPQAPFKQIRHDREKLMRVVLSPNRMEWNGKEWKAARNGELVRIPVDKSACVIL